MSKKKWSPYVEIGSVALITIIAGCIRFIDLDTIPPGLHGDEAWTGLDAVRILQEGSIGPYVGSALGNPAGAYYWAALIFKLLGASVFSIRFSMAILGTLTIPLAYLLYKTLFTRRVAVLGIFFFTFSCWHLFYSRMGFVLTSLPLMEILCLLFLFQGLKTGKILFFIVSGIFLGGAIYTYNTFFLFIVAVLMFLGGLILTSEKFGRFFPGFLNFFPRRRPWREQRSSRNEVFKLPLFGIFGFFISFLLVAYPMMHFILKDSQKFFSHFRMNNIFHDARYLELNNWGSKLQFILNRFLNSWNILFHPKDIDAVDGYGIQAIFHPVVGVLFIVGMIFVLLRLRDSRYQLILLMVLMGAIAVTFSLPWHGQYRRWVGAIPALMVIPAIAVDQLIRFFESRSWRKVWLIFVFFPLGWGAVHNLTTYFTKTPSHHMVKWVYCYDLVQALNFMKPFDLLRTKIYFFSGRWSYNYETRRFLLPHVSGEDRSREFGRFDLTIPPSDSSVLFVILPPYRVIIPQLQTLYPEGQLYEYLENGQFIFATYYYEKHV